MSELSIIKTIIISLQYLNLYYIADVFLVISLILFCIAIYKNIKIISLLLTGLGIFITILIIFISISKFNTSAIENNLTDLLNNLGVALIFGFFNLLLVWILRLINARRTVEPEDTEITPTAIYLMLLELNTYNNITQKPLLSNIFEQLKLIQENTQKIIEIYGVSVSQELDLLKTIKNDIINEGLLIIKSEITDEFNKLDNDIDKIQQGLQNIVNKINLVSSTELAKSLQEIKPYLESLRQLHIQANDSFPKIEQNLTELTQGIQQVLQNNLELLKTSMETQLDMAEVSIENVQEDKLAVKSEEYKSICDKAFKNMDAGDYQNAIIYFDQAIEINSQEFSLFYNQACCYALLDQTEPALEALHSAILLDKQCVEMASTDLDFDKIRYDSRFQVLLN
ncbi:MAG TPA: hypothetical protein ENK59_01640 [Thioploca sp.]|nr:hypothetical protein [Thioploca sp.]